MENKKDKEEKSNLKEEISAIGQIIVGELESIGGTLTGNPTSRAEGDLHADAGILREKIAHEKAHQEKDKK